MHTTIQDSHVVCITTHRESAGCVGSTRFGTETNASSLTAERIHLLRLVCLASWSSPLTAHARLLSSPDTQGPRPRADATSEPHGRPPPPCTELNHGEHLTLYPHLRRAHPTSSSSTAPDVREEGASLCGRKEGVTEWNPVRRDPSPARANGGAAAPSDTRKTPASARLNLGATGRAWASWAAWPGGLQPAAHRHTGRLPLPTGVDQTQTSSSQHRFEPPSAVPVLPRAPFTARALDSRPRRPPADPARSAPAAAAGTCRAAARLRPPPPRPSPLGTAGRRRFLRGAAAGRGRGRLHGAARRPALGLLLRWLRHCIEDRLRAPLQHHRSRPLPSFGSKKLRLQLRWLQIPLTPSFPLLGDCLLESTTQTPLVVVFSIITTMVSTCFLPSAQLSISKAFASAKLGEVRTALDSFIFFLLFVLHTFNSFMLLLLH